MCGMKATSLSALSILAVLASVYVGSANGGVFPPGVVNVSDFMPTDGKADVADAIQRVIDSNPNRTIWFPDGTYLLSKPICTPAHPKRSVDLQLSNYAVLKAAPGWTNTEAMVRLGGIHPANDIRTVGSCYSLTGGVIDGSGVAKGVSIDSGRETKVRNVSMKFVSVGLHIKYGANNGSSDCDISDVNIVGNKKPGSVGVIVDGHDNTFANMRIADVQTGVRLKGNGNFMTNLHPLYTNPKNQYADSCGFRDSGCNNSYNRCYSDHFSTGWFFGAKVKCSYMDGCFCFWYAKTPGARQTAICCEGRYNALSSKMYIGFWGKEGQTNSVMTVGEKGGTGILENPHFDAGAVGETERAHLDYLRGGVH